MDNKQPNTVVSEKMETNEVTDLGFLPGNIYQTLYIERENSSRAHQSQ